MQWTNIEKNINKTSKMIFRCFVTLHCVLAYVLSVCVRVCVHFSNDDVHAGHIRILQQEVGSGYLAGGGGH